MTVHRLLPKRTPCRLLYSPFMLAIKSAESLKYLTLPKPIHSVRPMALLRHSCAVISKRQTDTDWHFSSASLID